MARQLSGRRVLRKSAPKQHHLVRPSGPRHVPRAGAFRRAFRAASKAKTRARCERKEEGGSHAFPVSRSDTSLAASSRAIYLSRRRDSRYYTFSPGFAELTKRSEKSGER